MLHVGKPGSSIPGHEMFFHSDFSYASKYLLKPSIFERKKTIFKIEVQIKGLICLRNRDSAIGRIDARNTIGTCLHLTPSLFGDR